MHNYVIHTDYIHLLQIGPQYLVEFVFPRQPPRSSPRDNRSFLALQKNETRCFLWFILGRERQTNLDTWDLKEPRKYMQMQFSQKENKF